MCVNEDRRTSASELFAVILLAERHRWFGRNGQTSWPDLQSLTRSEFMKETSCSPDQVTNDTISSVYQDTFGKVLEEFSPEEVRKIIPPRVQSPVAPVIDRISHFRDEYLLEAIVSALVRYKSVFVSYGVGHLDRLLPALRAIEGSSEYKLESYTSVTSG